MEYINYLYLAVVLFALGSIVVLRRRNVIIMFMGIELMLNAANLAFVTFSRMYGDVTGQVAAFFVMTVAAAEVVVGLAIIVSIYRSRRTVSADDINLLKVSGECELDPATGKLFTLKTRNKLTNLN